MIALGFPNLASLRAALAGGVIPAAIAARPARTGVDASGPWVAADGLDAVAERAARIGARIVEEPAGGRAVSCWAEVLPAERAPEPPGEVRVLFELATGDLLGLAGELVRLGCDRQRWHVDQRAMLVANAPPWFSVLRAAEPASGVRAFLEHAPGVWVELGWSHPLAAGVRPAPGELVRIPGEGPWETAPDGPWADVYERIELALPGSAIARAPVADPPRLAVTLRLVPAARRAPPSLWVLRGEGRAAIERLISTVPDEVVDRLLFAATDDEEPLVVLRARPSPRGPPSIELACERYAPRLDLANVWLPDDATLEPPLRRETLRRALAPEPHEIVWLAPTADGFTVERIAEGAFQPLSAWVDYVVARADAPLSAWVESATLAFDAFVDAGVEWGAERPESVAPAEPDRRERRRPTSPEPIAEEPPRVSPAIRFAPAAIPGDAPSDALVAELASIERRFLALDAPSDAPERVPLWAEMSALSRRLGRAREAALCMAHAVWTAPSDQRAAVLDLWADAELAALGGGPEAARARALAAPDPASLTAAAACIAAGRIPPDSALASVFARVGGELDVRTAWLAARALAGGEPLALARARDAALARLRGGLSLDRDTLPFLRRADPDAVQQIAAHLDAQREHFRVTPRNRSVLEGPPELTQAYVGLVFAWGAATLGDRERAARYARDASTLDRSDPVHGALTAAYDARIRHAFDAVPREAPLPVELTARIAEVGGLDRYRIDRLRQASGILESQEELDPFTSFSLGFADPRGPAFEALRGIDDPRVLRERLVGLLDGARGEGVGAVLVGALAFLPLLAGADAVPLLERIIAASEPLPPLERVRVFESGLLVAGQLARAELASDLTRRLDVALTELGPAQLALQGDSLIKGLRALRRVGLQHEAEGLLERVIARADGSDLDSRITRICAAGGLIALDARRGVDEIDVGVRALDDPGLKVADRLRLTRALGLALSLAPRGVALDRLPKLSGHLSGISDSLSTNTHFCLSVVHYAESTVLGYADANLALSPVARRWLDDAELVVRREILRDA